MMDAYLSPRRRLLPKNTALALLLAAACWPARAAAQPPPPWSAMDYGPFLSVSVEAPEPPGNLTPKALVIRLGGPRRAHAAFDTDLLRFGAGWTGGSIDWRGIAFDGSHNTHPSIAGEQVFGNPVAPGWSEVPAGGPANFDDPRPAFGGGRKYGPMPRERGRWKGLYLHGQEVVLAYAIGGTEVLELPGLAEREGPVFTRTLRLGPRTRELALQVAFEPGGAAVTLTLPDLLSARAGSSAATSLAVLEANPGAQPPAGKVVAAACAGAPAGAAWDLAGPGSLRLRIPAGEASLRLEVLVWRGARRDLAAFADLARGRGPVRDPAALTAGGPARWPAPLETRGVTSGEEAGPFAVDQLTAPAANPWRSWLRFGGFDFLDAGRAAALGTWNGDVWTVAGIDGEIERLVWRRIATGLFQPLGIKVIDGRIHVLGRDQITRLHDLNQDGEADWYECVNHDAQVTEHFHEFAMDLQEGPDGALYYTKAGRHALDAVVPQHGTLLRVSPGRASTEIIAAGFRAPNGLCVNGDGSFIVSDQEGHWTPMNRINWVRPGGFYGYRWSYGHGESPAEFAPPLCWIPKAVDRSPAEQLWVRGSRWGDLEGALLSLSYGTGRIFLVLHEEVAGVRQGGVVALPGIHFPTGVLRGRFHPGNGQLYACGLFGWAGDRTADGGFYRVRRTEAPLRTPLGLHATSAGLAVTFSAPLDPASAVDAGNWSVERWNYRWTAQYGSDEYRVSDGRKGRDAVRVTGLFLAADRRTVFLRLEDMRPCMQMQVRSRLRAADGAALDHVISSTVNVLGETRDLARLGLDDAATAVPAAGDLAPRPADLETGLVLGFSRPGESERLIDARRARLIALRVPAGSQPSLFADAGEFTAEWSGWIASDLRSPCSFQAAGAGEFRLEVNGAEILRAAGDAPVRGAPLELRAGLNAVRARYRSPPSGEARLRLEWSVDGAPFEPVSPLVFRSSRSPPELAPWELLRRGRKLYRERLCGACHAREEARPTEAPRGPSLREAGASFHPDWLRAWIADPRALRRDAAMPRLLHGEDAAKEAADIASALAGTGAAGPPAPPAGDAARGQAWFAALGCEGCHPRPGEGAADDLDRVTLDFSRARWRPAALVAFLRAPDRRHPATRMPDFGLDAGEAADLAAYLLAAGARELRPSARTDAADPERGRRLIAEAGCARCHEVDGIPAGGAEGSTLPRLAAASGAAGRGCLAAGPRAGRSRAPDFALAAADRDALAAFLAAGLASLDRREPAGDAAETIAAFRCGGCHALDGREDVWSLAASRREGSPGPKELAAALGVEGLSDDQTRPPLTWAGERLRSAWLEDVVLGRLPRKPRPGLLARMPRFAAAAGMLAPGLALAHGLDADAAPEGALDPEAAALGRELLALGSGFGCVQCHPVGDEPPAGGDALRAIDLAPTARRLRKEYYHRYLLDPARIDPANRMPRFTDDAGRSVLKQYHGGDAVRQFEAIWQCLRAVGEDARRE